MKMEYFIPKSPKIKYIIPKVKPSFFLLNELQLETTDSDEKNGFNIYDGNDEGSNEYKSDIIKEKSLDDLSENSIFKTLLYLRKKKESISSIETKDSF